MKRDDEKPARIVVSLGAGAELVGEVEGVVVSRAEDAVDEVLATVAATRALKPDEEN